MKLNDEEDIKKLTNYKFLFNLRSNHSLQKNIFMHYILSINENVFPNIKSLFFNFHISKIQKED